MLIKPYSRLPVTFSRLHMSNSREHQSGHLKKRMEFSEIKVLYLHS